MDDINRVKEIIVKRFADLGGIVKELFHSELAGNNGQRMSARMYGSFLTSPFSFLQKMYYTVVQTLETSCNAVGLVINFGLSQAAPGLDSLLGVGDWACSKFIVPYVKQDTKLLKSKLHSRIKRYKSKKNKLRT